MYPQRSEMLRNSRRRRNPNKQSRKKESVGKREMKDAAAIANQLLFSFQTKRGSGSILCIVEDHLEMWSQWMGKIIKNKHFRPTKVHINHPVDPLSHLFSTDTCRVMKITGSTYDAWGRRRTYNVKKFIDKIMKAWNERIVNFTPQMVSRWSVDCRIDEKSISLPLTKRVFGIVDLDHGPRENDPRMLIPGLFRTDPRDIESTMFNTDTQNIFTELEIPHEMDSNIRSIASKLTECTDILVNTKPDPIPKLHFAFRTQEDAKEMHKILLYDEETQSVSINFQKLRSSIENEISKKVSSLDERKKIEQEMSKVISSENHIDNFNGHILVGVLHYVAMTANNGTNKLREFTTKFDTCIDGMHDQFITSEMGSDLIDWFSDSDEEE